MLYILPIHEHGCLSVPALIASSLTHPFSPSTAALSGVCLSETSEFTTLSYRSMGCGVMYRSRCPFISGFTSRKNVSLPPSASDCV